MPAKNPVLVYAENWDKCKDNPAVRGLRMEQKMSNVKEAVKAMKAMVEEIPGWQQTSAMFRNSSSVHREYNHSWPPMC